MSDFYTVSQYAELMKKDPGNIRRMLISGALKGEKAGNQWLIPKDVQLPEDKRVKTGNYRNWRKMPDIRQTNPLLMKNIGMMCKQLVNIYGSALDKIVLYGSYARGEASPESDVDIALIVKKGETKKMHDSMTDIVVDYELECGVTLSVVSIEYDNYMEWKNILPYYKNIDKEGIVLWKAA
jgi:predicted nucleotidyltransferase